MINLDNYPNADSIKSIIESVQAHPSVWAMMYDTYIRTDDRIARQKFNKAWYGLKGAAEDVDIDRDALYNNLCKSTSDDRKNRAELAGWAAVHGLLTGDFAYMLESPPTEVYLLAALDLPHAVLLSIAVRAFEEIKRRNELLR